MIFTGYKGGLEILTSAEKQAAIWAWSYLPFGSGKSVGHIERWPIGFEIDFVKFYEIALKSANETKYWLGLLRDSTQADKDKINSLLKEVEEISKMLGSSLLTLKNKNKFWTLSYGFEFWTLSFELILNYFSISDDKK